MNPRLAVIIGLSLLAAHLSAGTFNVLHSFGTPEGDIGTTPNASVVAGPDGTLYGTATDNGLFGYGVVYDVQTNGYGFALWNFANTGDGAYPYAELVLGGHTLYGTTAGTDGTGSYGTVFKVNTDGTGFATIYNFTNGTDGNGPRAGLVLDGNVLYGTASAGGATGLGTVFKVNTDGSEFAVLKNFSALDPVTGTNVDGAFPMATLLLNGGILYGTTTSGGHDRCGTVFAVPTGGGAFTVLHPFDAADGAYPQAGLVLVGGQLFGTASGGGAESAGAIFRLNLDGSGFTNLYSLGSGGSGDGSFPLSRLVAMGGTLYGTASSGGDNGNGTIFSINADGTDFQPFYAFTTDDPINGNFDGANPTAGLLAYQGVLYGTASIGGPVYYSGYGTVFQINPDGSGFEPLDYFDNVTTATDGSYPQNNLILGGNVLYGLTTDGGFNDDGGVFKVNLDGTGFSLLHSFDYVDGQLPTGGLQLIGNTLYGLTTQGGAYGYGTVFSLQTDGTGFTNLYSFTNGVDGGFPYGGLTLVSNVFYGTTSAGGTNSLGGIFCIGPDGSGFRSLHAFDFADGSSPLAGLTSGGGTLYGEAYYGGNGNGTLFKIQADGTGFAVLRSFSLITGFGPAGEGANPEGGLILSGGTLYGTTYAGGENHSGNIFKINTDGSGYATLWNFDTLGNSYPYPNLYGAKPAGEMVLLGGQLYGTASEGGSTGSGTLFVVSTNANAASGFTNLLYLGDVLNYGPAYPLGGLLFAAGTLYGTTYSGGGYGLGTLFVYNLVPPLQIMLSGGAPVVYWQNDGDNHTLQSTTNLSAGNWVNAPALNWTNGLNLGLQITNHPPLPAAFFRLKQ